MGDRNKVEKLSQKFEDEDDMADIGEDLFDLENLGDELKAYSAKKIAESSSGRESTPTSIWAESPKEQDQDEEPSAESPEDDTDLLTALTTPAQSENDKEEAASGILKDLAASGREQVERGEHVLAQQALWERLLQLRMVLNGPLGSGNRMPQPGSAIHSQLVAALPVGAAASQPVAALPRALHQCSGNLSLLLQSLVLLQRARPGSGALAQPTEHCDKCVAARTAECSCSCHVDKWWAQSRKLRAERRAAQNGQLNEWYNRAQLSSAFKPSSKANLNAFHQPLSDQVQAAMQDRARLLRRAHTNRAHSDPIGGRAAQSNPAEKPAGPQDRHALLEESSVDLQLYDDTDFFQVMLRDMIRGDGDAAAGLERNVAFDIEAAQASLRATLRLHHVRQQMLVDRRASKGRALRYTVQPKLVSFLAPQVRELPPNTEALFSNLFGVLQGSKDPFEYSSTNFGRTVIDANDVEREPRLPGGVSPLATLFPQPPVIRTSSLHTRPIPKTPSPQRLPYPQRPKFTPAATMSAPLKRVAAAHPSSTPLSSTFPGRDPTHISPSSLPPAGDSLWLRGRGPLRLTPNEEWAVLEQYRAIIEGRISRLALSCSLPASLSSPPGAVRVLSGGAGAGAAAYLNKSCKVLPEIMQELQTLRATLGSLSSHLRATTQHFCASLLHARIALLRCPPTGDPPPPQARLDPALATHALDAYDSLADLVAELGVATESFPGIPPGAGGGPSSAQLYSTRRPSPPSALSLSPARTGGGGGPDRTPQGHRPHHPPEEDEEEIRPDQQAPPYEFPSSPHRSEGASLFGHDFDELLNQLEGDLR
ncbi:putative apoptosis antagonizing transcription factor [Paratrimastix pyriformis]|uniref:Apoptosis antagonizing transcription factor n=1 Tax=Paratrimastix pyriformis TaxID=342808 RepID=A0ABQ8U7U8_9EUKA|nr:putative apoptosis antagonizing transcription factor [Paratrimastix pyriformis]